jgi:5-methyltetrahydropteroyltriglutamate--homocysteine methyltransferase
MKIQSFLTGLFPRSKELRKAIRAYQKKEINKEDLEKVYSSEANKLIEIQKELGISYYQEGMLKWQDLLRPLCNYHGIQEGTLIRWFETNFFYRMPIIKDKIKYEEPVLREFYCLDTLKGANKVMIPIPDPLTFAILSENYHYSKIKDLVDDISEVIIDDISNIKINIDVFQVISPAIGYYELDDEDLKSYNDFLKKLRYFNKRIIVHFSFIRHPSFLSKIQDYDILSLDLCYGDREKIIKAIPNCNALSLGLIDVSTSLIEEASYLLKEIKRISNYKKLSELYITNSSDLDLLPYEKAIEKIKVIKEVLNHEL